MIAERIAAFVEGHGNERFDELLRAAVAFQVERLAPMRRLCRSRGIDPSRIGDWRQVPAVPASAFKAIKLCAAEEREVFRSSGTTEGTRRSVHYHPFPALYRTVIDATFPVYCLPRLERPPALSLVPSREQLPDSSLSFMVDHVLRRHAGDDRVTAVNESGVLGREAMAWLGRRQRSGEPGLILATALALLELLDALDEAQRRFLLPPETVVFETGGLKGRRRTVTRDQLLERVSSRLGVPASAVVREYGMTELTSQAYTGVLFGDDAELFFTPPWLRAHVLDPESLEEVPAGETGLLALFDLANVGSVLHLLTEDLGAIDARTGGFRLAGRAAGAELRGCSLTVEELGTP
jgi:hypothetical protein